MWHCRHESRERKQESNAVRRAGQVLDELFKGAHVEGGPKVSPGAAAPTEVTTPLAGAVPSA